MAKKIQIEIYTKALQIKDYLEWTADSSQFETTQLQYSIDIKPLRKEIDSIKNNPQFINDKASSDCVLAKVAHKVFKKLPNSVLTDNRFWQWIALNEFLDYSIWRWDMTPENIDQQANILRHVISGRGVGGLSRNSISRLVIPCVDLFISPSDYSLVDILFQNQQTEQSLTQSMQSMNPKTFRAMVKSVKGLDGDGVKEKIKRLNALSDSYNLDLMTEVEIQNTIN